MTDWKKRNVKPHRQGGGMTGRPMQPEKPCGAKMVPALVRLPLVMWQHRRELREVWRTGATA